MEQHPALTLLLQSQKRLFHFCLSITHNQDAAQDLQQRTNEKMIRRIYDGEMNTGIAFSYFATAAKRLFIDEKRAHTTHHHIHAPSQYDVVFPEIMEEEEKPWNQEPFLLERIIEEGPLSPIERDTLIRKLIGGKRFRVISAERNEPENTTRTIFYRAARKLRNHPGIQTLRESM